MAFTPTAAERAAAHRAGKSSGLNRRDANAAFNVNFPSGDHALMRSRLATSGTATILTTGVAYWVFVGRAARTTTFNKITAVMGAAGVGAGVGALAVATSDAAPSRTGQVLTVQAVTTAFNFLVGTTQVNTDNLGFVAASTDFLWVGVRTAFATTQPTLLGVQNDFGTGEVLQTAGSAAFAVGTQYTGALVANSSWQGADLILSTV